MGAEHKLLYEIQPSSPSRGTEQNKNLSPKKMIERISVCNESAEFN
jgi:hypothetical protein